jgi:class 3 adenylate cyclase
MNVRTGSRGPPSTAQVRKTVTIVFADLAGSTAVGERLDPEALRDLHTRYFAAMRRPLERHGGTVEKYIGDAVMAVFGIPVLHEDDALRAVRAAVEMRDAMAQLNRELEQDLGVGLELRIGINTGEVAGIDGATDHGFVSGDAVNTAARLQSAASPGGIVIGAQTRRLVEGAVRLRSHEPVDAKGKRRPLRIWQVDGLVDATGRFTRGSAVPLVGRRTELRMLATRFRRAVERGRCGLVTVTGPAGIGKSRLVKEFLAGVESEASVVVGRCLPYGEGITYWPLIEIVNDLAGGPTATPLVGLLAGDPQPELVASRVEAAAGRRGATATEQDVQWAVRRLFEALARQRPVVALFDDIHWAEPAMLDLIEHVASNAAAPVLIVCSARGELLERRPGWEAAGGPRSVIRLRALSPAESSRLLRRLAARRRAPVRRDEVMAAAEGNPLFLEQLVAMRADDAAGRTPPTIQALLSARIDALPDRERRVVEAASIEGRGFHRGAVGALVGDVADVDAALAGLVDRELVRHDRSEFSDETGYRFTHILVRDAAYDLLAKRRRADLHVAYAGWLLDRDDRGSASDEIVGYHLEQAYNYRTQLGRADDARHLELASVASGHLAHAGRRALAAGDRGGAANLLERAVALRKRDDPERATLLIDLGGVLREEGRFGQADAVLREAGRLAAGLADPRLEARAQVERLLARLQVDPDAVARQAARHGPRLEEALVAGGDNGGLARLWHVRGLLWWIRGRSDEAERAWKTAAESARLAGDTRIASDILGWEASSMFYGSTPASAAIPRCTEICRLLRDDPWAKALAQQPLAALHAMRTNFGEALVLLDAASAALAEFGPTVDAAASHAEAYAAILAGDLDRADRQLRQGRQLLSQMGERAVLASVEGYLGVVALAQGRPAEAERRARESRRLASADDVSPQVLWRQVRARVLATRGQHKRACVLAEEAVALAATTDQLNLRADTLVDLAIVLRSGGAAAKAKRALRSAVALYDEKENAAGVALARRLVSREDGRSPARPAVR